MKATLRYYELSPTKLLHEHQASSWKELHNILALNGWAESYEGGFINEYEYETHIRNLDSRPYKHDVQRETSSIVLKTPSEGVVIHLKEIENNL